MSGKLIANDINLTAKKGFIVSLDANAANNSSYYVDILACRKTLNAIPSTARGMINLEGGSANINTKIAFVTADLEKDLSVKTSSGAWITNSEIGGTVDINSNGLVQMESVKAGDTTINSNKYTKLFDVDLGNTTITDTSDNYIVIGGHSTINGDLTATAVGSSAVDDANVILGWYDKNANLQDGSVTVTGKLTANASGNIGYSNTVKAGKIEMTTSKGSIFQAKSDNINGKLVSDDVSLSAPNGYIAALDGNVKNNSSEYFEAMQNTVSRDNFESAVGKNILDADAIDIKSATDNGDLKITIDTSVININADAGNTDLKVTPDTVENVVISSTGNLKTGDITIKKSNDDTTGNGSFTSKNGSVTIDNVKADTDIVISAGKDVKGTDLVADAEGNGVGDLIINAGGKADIDGGSGKNVDIVSGGDATIKNVTGDDDVKIKSDGNVTGENLKADNDNDKKGDLIIDSKGNVDINGGSGNNVDIDSGKNTTGTDIVAKDDITIDAGGNVKGDHLVADSDKDGIGDIIINGGGNVNINDAHGNTITINGKPGEITNSSADNGIFWNGIPVDGNNSLTEEVLKNLNNLQQSGVNTAMAQSFTPIAFAASDDDEEQSALAKRIAKTVFKTPDGVVTITDRFDTIK